LHCAATQPVLFFLYLYICRDAFADATFGFHAHSTLLAVRGGRRMVLSAPSLPSSGSRSLLPPQRAWRFQRLLSPAPSTAASTAATALAATDGFSVLPARGSYAMGTERWRRHTPARDAAVLCCLRFRPLPLSFAWYLHRVPTTLSPLHHVPLYSPKPSRWMLLLCVSYFRT